MNTRSFVRLAFLALLFVGLFTVAYFFLTHEGLYALDDYYYSRYAQQVATGTFRLAPDPQGLLVDPLRERPLIFGPVALLYKAFGVNSITTTLWPLLATLGCAIVLWLLYGKREPVVAAGAILLLGLHYFTLNLTNYLYPDNILMFWCIYCAASLLIGRRDGQLAGGLWGAFFALLNFAALLSKETIIYYLPFYIGVLLLDGWRRRNRRFWLAAFGVGTVLLLGYLALYQVYTDDALYRIHLIERTNEFLKEGNYIMGKRGALFYRLTMAPLDFFIGTGLGGVILFALLALLNQRRWPDSDAKFWLALAGSTLVFYWFGSTSLTQYNPITLLPRMTTPLLPPLCVAAGFGLRDFSRSGRGAGWLALALLACAGWARSSVSLIYGGLSLYFGLMAILAGPSARASWQRPGTYAFAALLLLAVAGTTAVRPAYFMTKPSVSSHFEQNQLIDGYLQPPARGVVFVDDYLVSNYDYYYDHKKPPGIYFRRYAARDSVRLEPGQQAWLLLNRSTLTNDELTRKLIRYSETDVLACYPGRQLVAEVGKVSLYKLDWGRMATALPVTTLRRKK
ncbi:ArnT family glycosyltransferase [Hymenobacter sp. HDW8]|uniref:ArnT family glycosyltransferase n=1 Tax=Hymenobacter sp. HDW8 TaxID=2714932 RepID=UPI00140E1C65|nr:hypothetical protein [Hymenobacter sp. HDW8]QIL74460.1 hypothetical protein G7064_00230 [Hymenobacter sp. HDW8]